MNQNCLLWFSYRIHVNKLNERQYSNHSPYTSIFHSREFPWVFTWHITWMWACLECHSTHLTRNQKKSDEIELFDKAWWSKHKQKFIKNKARSFRIRPSKSCLIIIYYYCTCCLLIGNQSWWPKIFCNFLNLRLKIMKIQLKWDNKGKLNLGDASNDITLCWRQLYPCLIFYVGFRSIIKED